MKKALRTVIIALLIVIYVFGQGLMISKGVGLPVRVAYAEGTADNEQGQEGVTPADPEPTGPEDVGDPAPSEEGEQDPDQEVPGTPAEDRQESEDEPGSPPEGEQDPEEDPSEPPTDEEEKSEDEPGSPPEGEQEQQDPSEPPAEGEQELEDPAGVPGQAGIRKGVRKRPQPAKDFWLSPWRLWASLVSFLTVGGWGTTVRFTRAVLIPTRLEHTSSRAT